MVEYWTCTMDDLSEEGKRLVEAISSLYGVPAKLMTVLDT